MKKQCLLFILFIAVISLVACGGGGGGGGTGTAQSTLAIVKIMTSGELPAGALIGAIDLTVNLPAGVSVKATADGLNPNVLVTDSGVAAVSGVAAGANATAMGTYSSSSHAVTLKVINPAGFGTGEFLTVNCDIAGGTTVTELDFPTATFSAVDLNGAAISGLTADRAVEFR